MFLQKTTEGGLATLCLSALWCLPRAWLGLKPFSRRAEVWTWGQHGHIPIARFGWSESGSSRVRRGGRHPWHPNLTCRGTQTTHGCPQAPWKSNLSQPMHFSLSQSHSSPTASLAVVISCLLSLAWVWPHPWVRGASLPQRPG